MKLTIRDQTCHLLAERAVFWEEAETLILADIHLGKVAAFQKAGIAVPEGSMEEDLIHIRHLIEKYDAKKCYIVGDLIHAKSGLSSAVKRLFSEWLEVVKCEIHLIVGNHDKSLLKSMPEEWPLFMHTDALVDEPFCFSHFPEVKEPWFVWSGHLHPKVELKSAQDRLVLRCFQIQANLGILPAFGSFVGGTFVYKEPGKAIYAVAENLIIEL